MATIKFTSIHDHIHPTDRRSVEFSCLVKRRLIDSREGTRFGEAVVTGPEEIFHLDAALVGISGADESDSMRRAFVGHSLLLGEPRQEARAFHCVDNKQVTRGKSMVAIRKRGGGRAESVVSIWA